MGRSAAIRRPNAARDRPWRVLPHWSSPTAGVTRCTDRYRTFQGVSR
ncbi:hypothetical protein BN903_42 [Halorubrum sp. AJ67]|nr:hypothetical protein BN903_42 [Halorubrum sp. AJ67]